MHVIVALVSNEPISILEQTPRLPDRLHALHVPMQVVLQQTPSAQLPLRHSEVALHICPSPFLHAPLSQALGAVHVINALVSTPPVGMFEQTPREPATLHALHVPVQFELQQ